MVPKTEYEIQALSKVEKENQAFFNIMQELRDAVFSGNLNKLTELIKGQHNKGGEFFNIITTRMLLMSKEASMTLKAANILLLAASKASAVKE